MLAHLFSTFWFAFLGEAGQFQRRSVSPKSFHSAAFRKIKDCFLGIWESVLPRPKFCGLPPITVCVFSSPERDRLSGGALVPLGPVGVWQQLGAAAEDLRVQFPPSWAAGPSAPRLGNEMWAKGAAGLATRARSHGWSPKRSLCP